MKAQEGPAFVSDLELLRLLNSAVLQSKEAILITDAELDFPGPRVVFVNPAFTAMTGYSPQEILGKTPRILQGPRTDRSVMARLRTNLENGERFEGEAINYRKNGTEYLLEWQIAPIREPGGAITHFVAVQRDITLRRQAEISSNRLAAIVEFSDDAIIGKDLKGIVSSWNSGAERIFGYTADEMVGAPITRLIPADRLDEEIRIMESVRRGQTVEHFETVRQTKDGRLIEVSVTVSPIRDSKGAIVGFSKWARDITARRKGDEARKSLEARYRSLFEYAPDGILIADPRSYYVDANPSICRMLGYTQQEMVGLHARDIVAPEEIQHIEAAIGTIHAKSNYGREWRFRRKDGSLFEAEVMATLMPEGNMMAMVRDVTERKRAEEQILEQAAIMDEARDAIIVRDLKGNVLYWNKGAERMYGWGRQEVVGRNIATVLYGVPNRFDEFNQLTLDQGEWRGEIQHVARDGRELTVETRWTLVRDKLGQPKSILAINSDITEKKKIEAQFLRAQRMESIGTLAGGIAHDLNNILAPIMMSIEVLKTLTEDEKSTKILETIEVSAKRGADIVRQVLSFARGVEGERVEVQPRHLLNDLEKIIKDTFPKDINLEFSVPKDTWTILGDPTQVHQVLLNLCVNARDAMPTGGGLSIGVENCVLDEHFSVMNTRARPGRYVKIEVADTGTGIPAEVVDKIFEPFFTTKALNKGTGLGLSTVAAIVKSHEGMINVYSELGTGSVFKVYLPAIEISSDGRKVQSVQASLPRGNGETILVVDDEASVLSITSQTLQAFGYKVLTATDGADALAVYVQHRNEVSVILTDIMMPVMDGPAMIHAVRRMNPSIKVVAASGLNASGELAKVSGTGVRHFLTKPYTALALLKTMREILDESGGLGTGSRHP